MGYNNSMKKVYHYSDVELIDLKSETMSQEPSSLLLDAYAVILSPAGGDSRSSSDSFQSNNTGCDSGGPCQ